MTITQEQALKILTGNYTSSKLSFSMLLTKLKGRYAKNVTQSTLQDCTDEINSFFIKYSPIMQDEFDIIAKL